jgi:hypothetical protein
MSFVPLVTIAMLAVCLLKWQQIPAARGLVTRWSVPKSPLPYGRSNFASCRTNPSPLHAVTKKDSYTITVLPGDGIGPEITAATKEVLQSLCSKCGFTIQMKDALIGGAAIDAVQNPFPDMTYEQCRQSDSILLACIGGFKWDTNPRELRPETGLLAMRSKLGLFANLRPAKVLPQLIDASTLKRHVVEGVDIMVVRELTGDVYFGTPKGIDVVDGESTFDGASVRSLHSFASPLDCRSYESRTACRVQQHGLQRKRN